MENKTYEFDIYGENISVTTDEVLAFYHKEHNLTEKEIDEYAAKYTAWIKQKRNIEGWLNKEHIKRIFQEERLMKNGETESFKLKLHFTWFVRIKKQTLGVFKYTVLAYCLDNIQSHERSFTSLEKAILHCLNAFNENVNIKNKFTSLKEYLSENN